MAKTTPDERATRRREEQAAKAQKAIDGAADEIVKIRAEIKTTEERAIKDRQQADSFTKSSKEGWSKIKQLQRDMRSAEKREKSKRGAMAKMLTRHSQKIRRG